MEAANVIVEGTDGTIELVKDIARTIKETRPDQTTMHDCWRRIEDSQYDINKKLQTFRTEPSHESITKQREALEELDNFAEWARTRVRNISSDFEGPVLDIGESIKQLKQIFSASVLEKVSAHLQTSDHLQTTVPIRNDNPSTLGKVLFDMPLKNVQSQWGRKTVQAVQRIRDAIYQPIDHWDTQKISERLQDLTKAMDLGDDPFNMSIKGVVSQWEKAIQAQRDEIYQSLATDLGPTMQSFQDKISKHMLNFTRVMVPLHIEDALHSMLIAEVALKWGLNYAKAVQLLRGDKRCLQQNLRALMIQNLQDWILLFGPNLRIRVYLRLPWK